MTVQKMAYIALEKNLRFPQMNGTAIFAPDV